MEKVSYGIEVIAEMRERFSYFKGDADIRMQKEHHEAFEEVIEKAGVLINSIKKMRDLYKKDGFLPLYYVNSEYEDMLTMLDYIEEEILMFGKPMIVQKNYIKISEEEINEIKNDPTELVMSGFDKWVKEKLI